MGNILKLPECQVLYSSWISKVVLKVVFMWIKIDNCTLLRGMQNGAAALENSLATYPKLKCRVNIWPSNSTPRIYTQGNWKHTSTKDVCLNVHSSVKSQKMETTYTSISWWMDKQCDSHTMKYYSAIKRNEVLIYYATIWWTLKTLCYVK